MNKKEKINKELKEFLMSDEGCISIEEARKEISEKWSEDKTK